MPHRRNQNVNDSSESVRLTRKFAERLDGVDLTHYAVGDTMRLSHHDADLIVAEGWGERVLIRRSNHPPVRRHGRK